MATLSCLYTYVKNMAGVRMHFGFLPALNSSISRGITLDDGEELAVPGDLNTRVAGLHDADRAFPAFEDALDETDIVILRSPAVHMYDLVRDQVFALRVNNGTLGVVDPCWGYYSEVGGNSFAGDFPY